MGYRIKRVDENQRAIVERFRALGAEVAILSSLGNGVPDLIVCHPLIPGWQCFVEVKDGNKKPSARRLTPDEERFHARWTGNLVIISSTNEAETLILSQMRLRK